MSDSLRASIHLKAYSALTSARDLAREVSYQINPMLYESKAVELIRSIGSTIQRLEHIVALTSPDDAVCAAQKQQAQALAEEATRLEAALGVKS